MLTNRTKRRPGLRSIVVFTIFTVFAVVGIPAVQAQTDRTPSRTATAFGNAGTLLGTSGCDAASGLGISARRSNLGSAIDGTAANETGDSCEVLGGPTTGPGAGTGGGSGGGSGTGFDRVIQLGDSFSSGVGALPENPAFTFGRHACANPHYFRDEVTPGVRIAHDLGVDAVFGACSGTLVETEALGMNFAEQIQLVVAEGHAVNGGANTLIVYSIAGNDLEVGGEDWVSIVAGCYLPGAHCDPRPTGSDWTHLEAMATQAHNQVRSAFPNATVRVIGYPLLFNRGNASCNVGSIDVDGVDFGLEITNTESDLIDGVNQELNTRLASVVAGIAATGYDIDFVAPGAADRPGACHWQSGTHHVEPHILNGSALSQNSFHPSERGYQGMYEDLAANLGMTPQPIATIATSAACNGASASGEADPWGARIGAGVRVRSSASENVLNNSLLVDTQTSISITVDMLGEPVGTANLEAYVETPGGTAVPVTLSPACYRGSTGADRGVYTGTANLRTDDPFSSIVARLRDASGNLIASGHSGVASVERLETRNTVESVGVRINNSALDHLEEMAEFELERIMEEMLHGHSVHNGTIWVADVSGLDVQLNPMAPTSQAPHGGLRADVYIQGLDFVVRGPLGNHSEAGCNWRVTQNLPLFANVSLAFSPTATNNIPFTVADVGLPFGALSVTVSNAATQEVQLCGAHFATFVHEFVNVFRPNRYLNDALEEVDLPGALSPRWLFAANEVLGPVINAQVQAEVEKIRAGLPPVLANFDVTAPVSFGVLQGDANGIFGSVELTLPGGPVPDDRNHQPIGVSLTHNTAQGDAFDAAVFVELATINRKLALVSGFAAYAVPDMELDIDNDGTTELLATRITAAPYLTRGADGTACAGMCVQAQLPPVELTVYEGAGGAWQWSRDVLVTFDRPVQVTGVQQLSDGSFQFSYDTTVTPAASVLASADGSTAIGQVPMDFLWGPAAGPMFTELMSSMLPAAAPAVPLPAELGVLDINLSSHRRDVTGNTDVQVLLNLDLTPPPAETPLCDGKTPTIYGTPFDDVIFGTSGNDVIHALGGNDLVQAGGGNDTICGGTGQSILDGEQGDDRIFSEGWDDFIRGGSGDDVSWAGGGDDFMIGDGGRDWLDGAGGNDIIWGQDGSDIGLVGGAGDDEIKGGSGDDLIRGDDGNDRIWGGSNFELFSVDRDTIYGGNGNDWIDGGDRNDEIWGDAGIDTIDGGTGDDTIHGGPDRDIIRGGPDWIIPTDTDNDKIYGDGGNDDLYGGANADQIWGGDGDDWIHGGNKGDDLYGEWGRDTIHGDDGADNIHGGPEDDHLYGDDGADDIWGDGGYDRAWGGANIFDQCWAEWENSC